MSRKCENACMECKHLELVSATIWGCITCGPDEQARWYCQKGRYDIDWEEFDLNLLKSVLDMGYDCDLFESKPPSDRAVIT